jgi:phage gp36-like protein
MSYAIKSDLETRFGADEILQLADRDGSGVVDVGVIEAALADADVEIDGYLAVLYTLPLTPVPELVKRLSCDIARYRLWKDRASEQVRKGYEDSIDTLKRISAGTVRIVIVSTGVEPSSKTAATPGSRVTAFTDDVMGLML